MESISLFLIGGFSFQTVSKCSSEFNQKINKKCCNAREMENERENEMVTAIKSSAVHESN